ncbi:MAG TPA: hypothetical protein VGM19_08505 [Armatimonadota bacterium]|jgi:hypothetical protein
MSNPQPVPVEDLQPAAVGVLSPLGAVVWLLAAAVVGLVGSLLLEGARLAPPLELNPALAVVLPVELVLYLLAVGTGGPRLGRGRTTLGVGLGFLLRAGLAALLAYLAPSALAGRELYDQFLLYYVQLWPAAAVQVLSLTAFLWLARDLLVAPDELVAEEVLPPSGETSGGNSGERQRELLAALMEPNENAQGQYEMELPGGKLGAAPERRGLRLRGRRAAPVAPALPLEPPPPAPEPEGYEEAVAGPFAALAEDTATLPQVMDGPATEPEPPTPQLPSAGDN